MTEQADVLISNAVVISVDHERRIFAPGAIALGGGRILAVGRDADVVADYPNPRQSIDAGGGIVHPGFVETHMHVSNQLTRSAFADTVRWGEVLDVFFLDYWRAIGDEEEYIASVLGCLEMIRNGTTCFLEAGSIFSPQTAAEAAELVGIRALLSDPFIWDIGPLAAGETALPRTPSSTDEAIGLLGTQLLRNRDPDALVRGHVAIWGLGTASDQLYRAAKELASESGVVLNAHQSYDRLDVQADRERLGQPPVCHYSDLGVLDERTTLAHVNFLEDDEVRRLGEARCSVAWCPAVSMIWATGGVVGGRHVELLRCGCNVALGSDSSIVGNPLDLGQAAHLALLTARERSLDRAALCAEDAFEMATINGARAVGLESEIGSLEPGKRADLVIRRPDLVELCPQGDLVAQLMYTGSTRGVDTVIVNGRIVLQEGSFPHLDEAQLRAAAEQTTSQLFARMGWVIPSAWPIVGEAR